MKDSDPLSLKSIIAGLLITIVGGVVVAYITKEGRYSQSQSGQPEIATGTAYEASPHPLIGDDLRIVSISPSLDSPLKSGQLMVFEFLVHYKLDTYEQAKLIISLAEFPDTNNKCKSPQGSLVDFAEVIVTRGERDVSIKVTWLGGNGSGYLAPAPSYWLLDGSDRIKYFGVNTDYCYYFAS